MKDTCFATLAFSICGAGVDLTDRLTGSMKSILDVYMRVAFKIPCTTLQAGHK